MATSDVRPGILDDLSVLADAIRSRILLVLDGLELTVSELCAVLRLPQSTVSRHLKTLSGGGWVQQRPDGPRRLYRLAEDSLAPRAAELWRVARQSIAQSAAARSDASRLEAVLAGRRERSREFFDSSASEWDRLRDELFGSRFWLRAMAALLPEEAVVGDLGCGTGAISEALAPWVGRVIAVDGSQAMLEAAAERLGRFDNVALERGELERLPLADASLDVATLILVLHHVPHPGRVLAEVARVLRPGGRVLIVDMLSHDREEYRQRMGHVWLGFEPERMRRELAAVSLEPRRFHPLPVESDPGGPALFVQVARRASPDTRAMESRADHETTLGTAHTRRTDR